MAQECNSSKSLSAYSLVELSLPESGEHARVWKSELDLRVSHFHHEFFSGLGLEEASQVDRKPTGFTARVCTCGLHIIRVLSQKWSISLFSRCRSLSDVFAFGYVSFLPWIGVGVIRRAYLVALEPLLPFCRRSWADECVEKLASLHSFVQNVESPASASRLTMLSRGLNDRVEQSDKLVVRSSPTCTRPWTIQQQLFLTSPSWSP